MIPFTLWLALIWSAAVNGVFRGGFAPFPLLPFAIFLPVIIATPIVLRSKRMGQVLDAMPASWLIALAGLSRARQRLPDRLGPRARTGRLRSPGGIGDVTTGLLAVPVAISLAAGGLEGRKAAIAWNIFGLLDFAIAVSIGLMIAPGPLQVIVPSIPNATAGIYPNVMVPAFAVPSSILLHVLSLRQLRRRSR